MATSPSFNWPEPDNSDLVKNGALAIRTAVDAIDASMTDLRGGTTGQVLSKTSNTDMDFTWVAQDDSNAIQNAIVDAKGDLIAASAADTPARLAVGSDYGFLQADSAQSTGLVWNAGAWTTYTPTVTAQSGTYTTVSAAGRYIRIGKVCIVNTTVNITNNGTASLQTFVTAPFSASSSQIYSGCGRENAVQGFMLQSRITNGDIIRIGKYDGTYAGANGYTLDTTTVFEVA